MIDGDENSNSENSSDGEEDVGAGAGVGDEVIKMKRCVFATQCFCLSRETEQWWRGMGMLMVHTLKTVWAFKSRSSNSERLDMMSYCNHFYYICLIPYCTIASPVHR